jgi:hypothetical protein
MKTFNIKVTEVIVRDSRNARDEIDLTFDTQEHLILELLTVDDVVAHFDHEELLKAIGIEKAKEYWVLADGLAVLTGE